MEERNIIPHHCLLLDIGWKEFLVAASQSTIGFSDRNKILQEIKKIWTTHQNPNVPFISLSVRTTLDLFLMVKNFPKGSEVIMSAINIPDMTKVIREHGLRIVSLDVGIDNLTPKIEYLQHLISEKTVMILVAHVLGKSFDMQPFVDIAESHNLYLLEDCSQAFSGFDRIGHPKTDLAFFSFGTIKYCTAVGGSVTKVKDRKLYADMENIYATFPMQSQTTYLKKVMKTSLVYCVLNCPKIIKPGMYLTHLFGIDHKKHVVKMIRGFPDKFFENIRRQPSTPLLHMMSRQFRNFSQSAFDLIKVKGDYVNSRIPDTVTPVGVKADVNNYWLFPIIVENPAVVVKALNNIGIDAYHGATQLNVIEPDNGENPLKHLNSQFITHYPHEAKFLFDHVVYLPVNRAVPFYHLDRICQMVARVTKDNIIPQMKVQSKL